MFTIRRTVELMSLFAGLFVTGALWGQTADQQPTVEQHPVTGQASKALGDYPGQRLRDAFEKGLAYYELKVREHPNDAVAQAGLANSYTTLWCYGFHSRDEVLPEAKTAALKAVKLDDNLAAAHAALGVVKLCDWEWSDAEGEFQRALQLQPNDASFHHRYALYLAAMGRHDMATRESKRADELDASAGIKTGRGAVLYFARDFDQMTQVLQRAVSLDPNSAPAHDWLGMAYVQQKQYEKSIAVYQRAVSLSGGAAEIKAGLGHAYAVANRRDEALKILNELDDLAKVSYVPPTQIAYVCIGLGDRDRAFELLEQAYALKAWELVFLREEPWVDDLRSDPRFTDLLRRMRFPPKER